ncbi:MAG TPA: caspase family protein [Pyrinomonadaceae bacterium]|nr:caspase family protein [Pyrinomonadaceae bacterium]
MMRPDSPPHRGRAARRKFLSLALLALLGALLIFPDTAFEQASPTPASVFEIELPELSVAPTSQTQLTIPSPNVNQINLHVLRPVADNVDYSQLRASLNGEAAARIYEIVSNTRGKLIRLNLKRFPGFDLQAGRNTVEVWAQNRRGRQYYASFVVSTATENRNQDFGYQVVQSEGARQQVPPELVLLEPEREVLLPAGRRSFPIRLTGVATAATSVQKVTVNGRDVPLKRGAQVTLRGLGLANESNRVTFDLPYTVDAGTTQLVVEATDASGNRTQLQVPVRAGTADSAETFTGKKYALIIGISKYRNNAGGLADLKYADADAQSLHKFLQLPNGGRFSPDNMRLVLNEQATVANIKKLLNDFIGQASADDLLLVFIAGHGAPDPFAPQNLYFIAHDTNVDNMPETALAMKDFQRYLEQHVRARRLVLLVDTCHSAGLTGSGGEATRGLGNNLVSLYIEKLLYQEEGKAVITSSDVNELSQESTRWGNGHGVFTHFLLEGMQGKADANTDRLVTVGELFRYVRQKVRLDTQFRQNPRMLAGTNENLTLAGTPGTGGR